MSATVRIVGRVYYISPVETIGQNGFQKRFVIIDDSRLKDGTAYPNYIQVDFTGDRMAQLDNFIQTQLVVIEGYLDGREYKGKYFTNVRGGKISPYQAPQAMSTAPQGYAPQQQPYQSPQQPYQSPQQAYQAPQQAYQAPQPTGNPFGVPQQPAAPIVNDGLPF